MTQGAERLGEAAAGVPALFLIGAAKCGTTSLHSHLRAHPQLLIAEEKETFFFSNDERYRNGEAWYLSRHYGELEPARHRYFGESSTMYSMCHILPEVAGRIHRFKEDCRFLYLLRDPVERAISHYWHDVRLGIETRGIETAVVEGSHFLLSSDYALQIRAYLEHFPQERFLLSLTETFRSDPATELRRITDWLGLEPSSEGSAAQIRRNVTPEQITLTRGDTWIGRLKASTLWRDHLRGLVPAPIRALGKRHAVTTVNRKDPALRDAEARVRERIRPLCERSVRELEAMFSMTIEVWSSLRPDSQQ